MAQLLNLVAMRKNRAFSAPSRGSSQLTSLGKLRREHTTESEVPGVLSYVVPEDHPFTCLCGVCAFSVPDDADADADD
eukprot:6194879-Pleurochrysis_carterae.AAC.1